MALFNFPIVARNFSDQLFTPQQAQDFPAQKCRAIAIVSLHFCYTKSLTLALKMIACAYLFFPPPEQTEDLCVPLV